MTALDAQPGEVLAQGPGDIRWIAYRAAGRIYAQVEIGGQQPWFEDGGWWTAGVTGARKRLPDAAVRLLSLAPPPDDVPVVPGCAPLAVDQ